MINTRAGLVYTGTLLDGQRHDCSQKLVRSGAAIPAIRLPKDVAFGKDLELVVVRSGDVLSVYPTATSIPEMIARLEALPVPPSIEERDD